MYFMLSILKIHTKLY